MEARIKFLATNEIKLDIGQDMFASSRLIETRIGFLTTSETRYSVARFGEISPLWQDFNKLGHFDRVHLIISKIFKLLRLIL